MHRVRTRATLLCTALLLGGCDNTSEVTVTGIAVDVDTFAAGRFQGKPGKDALAAALRSHAVVYPDVDPKAKSRPTGPDGAFSLTFRAPAKSTFRLMVEGGGHPPVLWPVSYTVPATQNRKATIAAGATFACRHDAVQLAVARKAGFTDVADMLESAGTCMFINLGDGPAPDISLTTDARIEVKNPDAGVEVFPVNMTANMESSVVNGPTSPLGLYIILKRFKAGDPDEIAVRLQTTDPVTTAPRPFRFAEATCPIRKGFVTDLLNAPQAP